MDVESTTDIRLKLDLQLGTSISVVCLGWPYAVAPWLPLLVAIPSCMLLLIPPRSDLAVPKESKIPKASEESPSSSCHRPHATLSSARGTSAS